jgi:hypothetical protein
MALDNHSSLTLKLAEVEAVEALVLLLLLVQAEAEAVVQEL